MADTRDDLQRQADGYVRQGRLDEAIDAYEQVARATPTDWNLIKQIADLQERAGRREAAAGRFLQCADHYFGEGFLARAAALYRKVLKLDVKSEHALDKLAEVSLALKLKVDARRALAQLVIVRRDRGDEEGARQAAARLSALDGEALTSPPEASEVWSPEPTPEADPETPVTSEALPDESPDESIPPCLEPAAVVADLPERSAPDTQFDWGALLGRAVESSAPVVEPTPIDLETDSSALADAVEPADADAWAADGAHQARSVVDVQDDLEVEEVDLTDLLDQLAMERPLSYPPPMPSEGMAEALPIADAGEGGDAGDAGVLAARHLAAGRVFAAAGLVAEAARAFERASRDLRTRFEAAEALAGLHRSRGQMAEALRWYDEAARAPVADEAVRRPVLYDLAEALEAAGQPDRALAVLLDLLSEVEDYRDARARADRLLRVDAGG